MLAGSGAAAISSSRAALSGHRAYGAAFSEAAFQATRSEAPA